MKKSCAIDYLRIVSALLVALFHWDLEISSVFSQSTQLIKMIVGGGAIGVPIFFVISGYVIVLNAYHNRSSFHFLVSRFVRIFPALFLCVFLIFVTSKIFLEHSYLSLSGLVTTATLTYDYFGLQPITSVVWTLKIELIFYLSVYLLLLFFPRVIANNSLMFFVVSAFAFTSLASIVDKDDYAANHIFLNGLLDYFAMGICVFYLIKCICERLTFLVLLWSSLVVYILFNSSVMQANNIVKFIFMCGLLTVILSPLLDLKFQSSRFSRAMGGASYILYLIHLQIGSGLLNVLISRLGIPIILSLLICILSLIAFSAFIHRYLEVPMQICLRKRLLAES